MKADHYTPAAIIAAALIAERATFGDRTTREAAVQLYAELTKELDEAARRARVPPTAD